MMNSIRSIDDKELALDQRDDDDYYDVSYRLRKTKFVLPKKHIQQWAVFR